MLNILRQFERSQVSDFQSLKGKGGYLDRGLFIAEAPKVVERILLSPLRILSAYLTEEFLQKYGPALDSRPEPVSVFVAPKSEMEEIIGYPLHQGVMISVAIPESPDLFERPVPAKWIALALDGIADAENMGAILRNAVAFGVTDIILDDQSCNPYLRRAVRVSMGTIADVRIHRMPHLAPALEQLRESGVAIIGAALGDDAQPLVQAIRHDRAVLVFGSEGWGMRESVRRACTELRQIPMSHDVDSLNVAIANAIFLYEYTRRT